MSYAKRMTPEMRMYLGHLLPRIEELKPTQSLLLRGNDERHINNIRNHFYSWCKLMDRKSLYRTYKETSTTLRIVCIDTRPAEIIQDVPLNSIEEFVRDYLLDCDTEEEARAKIAPAIERGIITENDTVPILLEFKRMLG